MTSQSLDRRLTIERRVAGQDGKGQPVEAWTRFAAVRARRMDVRPRERLAAAQDLALRETVFRIRWRGDLGEEMRLVERGVVYEITGLAEVGRRHWLDISARAVAPGGL